MALARTRQATSIQKALQFQRRADPARCTICISLYGSVTTFAAASVFKSAQYSSSHVARQHEHIIECIMYATSTASYALTYAVCRASVELQRALSENALCRAPLLAARYTKEQVSAESDSPGRYHRARPSFHKICTFLTSLCNLPAMLHYDGL